MRTYFIPTDSALPFLRPPPPFSDELAKVGVAAAILSQQNDCRAVVDRDLRTDDQPQPDFPGLHMRPHHAVNPIPVGQSQRRQAEANRFLHQLVRMARAFEKRKITFAPEGNVGGHRRKQSYKKIETEIETSGKTVNYLCGIDCNCRSCSLAKNSSARQAPSSAIAMSDWVSHI